MSTHRLTTKVTVAAAIGAVVLSGSAAAQADRAGGDTAAERKVLSFFNSTSNDGLSPEQAAYADEVERLTGGGITFERRGNSREGSTEAERLLIEDVRDGTIDMGAVGVRVLDTLGVDSLQPLIAPMVIDSYELEQAVFESDLPARMLGPVDKLGVTGLAVLPGVLQRIIGTEDAFLTVDDFEGKVIAALPSDLAVDTYEALGATRKLWPAGAPLSGFDAIVAQFGAIQGRRWDLEAKAVTVNAIVWVRPWVVVVNPDVFDSLNAEHQLALREAAQAATAAIIEASRAEDRETLDLLCSSQLEFVTATDEQLDGMRAALEPVYAGIGRDPLSAEHLAEIFALKEQLAFPPDSPTCGPEQAGRQPSDIDGVYTRTVTGQDVLDLIAAGCDTPFLPDPADIPADLVIVRQIALEGGRLEWLESWNGGALEPNFIGPYDVFRDRLEVDTPYGRYTMHWMLNGANLVLSEMEGGLCDAEFDWTSGPWVRVEASEPLASPEGTR